MEQNKYKNNNYEWKEKSSKIIEDKYLNEKDQQKVGNEYFKNLREQEIDNEYGKNYLHRRPELDHMQIYDLLDEHGRFPPNMTDNQKSLAENII